MNEHFRNLHATKNFKKQTSHKIGAVSRYDLEYLKYYLPGINVEVKSNYIINNNFPYYS